ncbi:hypothetical protein [Kocuria palustris]|uniref:hypothetical protein n=1 Tax=Kocuria palustris TaxID=71999 RepID=UPI0011A29457|nr:hypothetical protein [Kocuria palustris]
MASLTGLGSAWRAAVGPAQRFSLRVYVAQEDLDGIYLPLIPHAVSPEQGALAQLEEQLARLAVAEDGRLPPRVDALWTLPRSCAPAAPAATPDTPLFHPSQRLRRSLQLFAAVEEGAQEAPLLPLLLPQEEVVARGENAAPEHFLPQYARQADWTVPLAWFALFREDDLVRTPFRGRMIHRLVADAASAAQRAARAAEAVEAMERDDVAELGEDLARMGRWVGSFPAGALITLDYGAIADRLQPDESPRDMEDAMAFVADGDLDSAAIALRRLVRRWLPLAQLEHAS